MWSLWFGSIPTERSSDPFVIEMNNVRIEITQTYSLDQINDGYADMHAGRNVRGVLVHDRGEQP